ncbi:unnamed protein product [Orchesella dallaii]|uniref:Reverse transcriptase domain-containing protein n=1 Tax=Orchesella dallaii TaxID=48710 RepID=A0ABP1QR15_9HEXA
MDYESQLCAICNFNTRITRNININRDDTSASSRAGGETRTWICQRCKLQTEDNNLNNIELSFSDNVSCGENEVKDNYEYRFRKGLNIAHININGLRSKFEEIRFLLNNEKYLYVLAVTETKLKPSRDPHNMYLIPNFEMIRNDRLDKEGGGTILYIHNQCCCEVIEPPVTIPKLIECNIIKISKLGVKPILVCTIYVPPDRVNSEFFEFFASLCDFVRSLKTEIIILGDFNVNWLEKTDQSKKLFNTANEYNLSQIINFPTRIADRTQNEKSITTATLLDHAYVSNREKYYPGGFEFGGSDHALIYVNRTNYREKTKPKVIESRCYKNFNRDEFIKDLNSIDWSFTNNKTCLDVNAEFFEKQIVALLDKHAPSQRKKVKGDETPWLTNEIRRSCQLRDKLKANRNIKEYRRLRNKITQQMANSRNVFYRNKFDSIEKGKNVWDVFDSIIKFRNKEQTPITKLVSSEGTVLSSHEEIATALKNEYVIQDSSEDIKTLNDKIKEYRNFYVDKFPEYESLEVSEKEVVLAIKSIKKCRTTKVSVPKRIYREFANELALPLKQLFMTIIKTGIVPQYMKDAICIPLYKGKGRRSNAGSYRAIFHLNFITKIFEKIVYNRLNAMTADKLNDRQHGFRRYRSCDTAIALFTQRIHENLDVTNGKAVAIFIDLKKAFDTVNQKLLLEKLMKEFELEPYMIELFASYFTNRRFKILNNKIESEQFSIRNGVPPGSALGAILFSLFINDIGNCIDLEYLLYADDMVIYVDCLDYNEGIRKINESLAGLERWCKDNSLIISVEKTKVMYFCKPNDYKSKNAVISEKVRIYGQEVEVVETFKYLGLIIDSTLRFKSHSNHVENKLGSAIGRMRSYKRLIPKSKIKIFVSAFCMSIVEYGINVWAIQSERDLEIMQSKINRFLISVEYPRMYKHKKRSKRSNLDMNKLLSSYNLLTIIERRKLSLVRFVYKYRKSKMFPEWFNKSAQATEECPRIAVPTFKKCHYKKSVRWNLINNWNIIVNKKIVYFCKELQFDEFVESIKSYLCSERSKVYLKT